MNSRFILAIVACFAALCVIADAQLHVPLTRKRHIKDGGVNIPFGGSPIPLDGGIASAGEYFASLYLGTPPQHFEVQVDTVRLQSLVTKSTHHYQIDSSKHSAFLF
jgi:hypothetical protein